jgi:hypothetical protein
MFSLKLISLGENFYLKNKYCRSRKSQRDDLLVAKQILSKSKFRRNDLLCMLMKLNGHPVWTLLHAAD